MKLVQAKVLKILLLLCFLVSHAKAVNLKCEYIDYIQPGYSCHILQGTINEDDSLTISGEHLSGKSDSDVKRVFFYNAVVQKVPNELFEKFPNLNQLGVEISNLKAIDQKSFKGAKNLEKFYGIGNYVKRLEADTFIDSPELKFISLHDNGIEFVHEKSFRNLEKLEELYLGENWIALVHKDTFKDLINLKILHLHGNKIEELPEGLFRNNLKLQKVELSNNKIKILPGDLFENLKSLEKVNLGWNTCISKTFNEGFTALSTLNDEVKKCTNANTLEAKNQQLANEIEVLKQRISSQAMNISALQSTIRNLNDNLQTFETSNQEFLSKQDESDLEINQLMYKVDDLKAVVNSTSKEKSRCELKNRQLNNELLAVKISKQDYFSELSECKQNITELTYSIDELNSTNILQAKEISSKDVKIKNLQDNLKSQTQSKEICRIELANMTKECEKEKVMMDLRFNAV